MSSNSPGINDCQPALIKIIHAFMVNEEKGAYIRVIAFMYGPGSLRFSQVL